jgi:hypothetical protein
VHLDRKFERMLALLLRLKDLPWGDGARDFATAKDPDDDTDGNEAKYGFGRLINVVPDSERS